MSIMRNLAKGSLFTIGTGCLVASGYCITMAAGFKNKKYLAAGFAVGTLGSICLNGVVRMDGKDTFDQTIDQVNDHLMRNGMGHIKKEDIEYGK